MLDRRSITAGMKVRGPDGRKVGYVTVCGDWQLQLDTRMLHGRDLLAPYALVTGIVDGDLRLAASAEALQEGTLFGRGEVLTHVLPVASLSQLHAKEPPSRAPAGPPFHPLG